MIIEHALVNWNLQEINEIHSKAKKLVLGSFNPNNLNIELNTDFYYGRQTNHFWKSIARNLNLNQNFFTNNLENKLWCMNKYEFTFYDVINSIEYECVNEDALNDYLINNIFANYADNHLFRVHPIEHNGFIINKDLNFNNAILEFLNKKKKIKIIHTMGNSRLNQDLVAIPNNQNLGFNPFINQILNICNENENNFISISHSPSQIAVNRGGVNYVNLLDNWINQHLLND